VTDTVKEVPVDEPEDKAAARDEAPTKVAPGGEAAVEDAPRDESSAGDEPRGEAAEEEASPQEPAAEDEESSELRTTELAEQIGRDASMLVFREVQLTTSRHIPEVRRVARDLAVVVGVLIAFASAFVLVNWALVNALSSPLPSWRAPLVLAAVWVVVGVLLTVFVLHRTGHLTGWKWWKAAAASPEDAVLDREQARDEALQALRDSLDQFAGAVARDAGALVAVAVVPMAGTAAEAGEKVLDTVDSMTDAIEDKVPGGSVINRVADLALKPGRYALGAVKGIGKDEAKDEASDEPAASD
jgi:hypothetical protein